ncbi:MAG: ABC transporter permease subunit [Clostridiaceae bacterium]|jgi:ABC-type dipeptide/oligopeptide/nickel transport system permease subunit|nr:ABC transporter permease subunit [Clostridiaceae bacterium]
MKTVLQNKKLLVACMILLLVTFCFVFAEVLAPHDPLKNNLDVRFSGSSTDYPLGTDAYGRCILSRLIFGTRYSVGLAVLIMCLIVLTALPLSLLASYRGGLTEKLLLLVSDISMALPPTVLVLSIIGVLGQGIANLIFAAVFSYWGWYGRMVRSYVLIEKGKGYVALAVTGGNSTARILFRHILPNILPGLLVLFALGIGDVIMTVSAFSFLGIALPSGTPEWGAMLNEARSVFLKSPQYAIYPGLCVFFTVCGFNLLGEGLRSSFSPFGKAVEYER